MNNPGLVGELALELWLLREETPSLKALKPAEWSRRLAVAIEADVAGKPHYHPDADTRVQWIRAVLESRRQCDEMPRAHARVEACCAFLIGKLEESGPPSVPEVNIEVRREGAMFVVGIDYGKGKQRPQAVRCWKDAAAGDDEEPWLRG